MPDMAATSPSRRHPQSIAIALGFPRFSPDQTVIRRRASLLPQDSLIAQHVRARYSRPLSLELSPLDLLLTTNSLHARCPVRGETVMRTRRRRPFAKTPRATDQQMRKWCLIVAIVFYCL